MVERQLRGRGIEDPRVLAAMGEVPRELFVADADRGQAYQDGAVPIASGQTVSQPWIVARMTELLELTGPERVLEVGTGSGYGAAILSRCASHVVTVERHAELARTAAALLAKLGYSNVETRVGDGSRGVADRAPYDAIAVTASASDQPPAVLLEQLVAGGTLVCPIERGGEQELKRFRGGEEETIIAVRFVPLVEGEE